ncbi:unnamed protein product [Lactuca virosa]|uniref:Uncharacterized protein n=1 Tax=Lactuca virosa TaxID=75947 RepID=A0AAU9NRR8_9ASTR|nr:unnamed protein product [Lactuca virosa]
MPLKSGVLQRLRRLSHKCTFSDDSQTVRKVQVSSKGVIVREIPTPASPSSKKRRAQDVINHISKKQYKRKIVLRDDSSKNEVVPDTPPVSSTPMVTSVPIISSVTLIIPIAPSTTIPLEIVVTKSISE